MQCNREDCPGLLKQSGGGALLFPATGVVAPVSATAEGPDETRKVRRSIETFLFPFFFLSGQVYVGLLFSSSASTTCARPLLDGMPTPTGAYKLLRRARMASASSLQVQDALLQHTPSIVLPPDEVALTWTRALLPLLPWPLELELKPSSRRP